VNGRHHNATGAARRWGFTVVELMLVIFIITLLIGIGVPSVSRIRMSYLRKTSLATLKMLEKGCEMYRSDFTIRAPESEPWKAYPPGGNRSLVWALTGYVGDPNGDRTPGGDLMTDDGFEGFGFRLAVKGLVYGPYNSAERVTREGTPPVFLDSFGNTIYYFRCEGTSSLTFVGGDTVTSSNNPTMPSYVQKKNPDSTLSLSRNDIILCTKGPDALWGSRDPKDDTVKYYKDFAAVDDVTNFLEEE